MAKRKVKNAVKSKKPTERLLKLYSRYFVQSPHAVDDRSRISLEQPSPFKDVPSVATSGVGEMPLIPYAHA